MQWVWMQHKPCPTHPQTFGERLRKHRLDGKLSRPEVEAKRGVPLSSIVKWEGTKGSMWELPVSLASIHLKKPRPNIRGSGLGWSIATALTWRSSALPSVRAYGAISIQFRLKSPLVISARRTCTPAASSNGRDSTVV